MSSAGCYEPAGHPELSAAAAALRWQLPPPPGETVGDIADGAPYSPCFLALAPAWEVRVLKRKPCRILGLEVADEGDGCREECSQPSSQT